MIRYLFLFVFLTILISSCALKKNQITEANEAETAIIRPIGDQVAKDLIETLQSELQAAIKKGGISEAIEVCNMRAIELTDLVAKSTDLKLDIKRTTLKYRNKSNAPDEYEKLALTHFDSFAKNNEPLPEFYIQNISISGENFYYYYKPMKVNPACLLCHGAVENIPPDYYSEIKNFYPDDKAVGYRDGDFRGLIRIKFFSID
ncbi:MAG: DUF3365 domain-containing protein [Bacteroidales bacterium]|nr:DUF3365 domain-containing protein [Bacteroidales bacterium]MCF8404293.1 DUF3365 domain-containing protein [Bacteroidales bacterium]